MFDSNGHSTTIRSLAATLLLFFGAVTSAMAQGSEISSALLERIRPNQLETPLPATSGLKEVTDSAAPDDRGSGGAAIAIGDRLKISVYMAYGSGNGVATADQGTLPTLMEQPDLSGQYVVQESGQLFLPIAGPVKIVDATLPAASKAIEDAFSKHETGAIRIGLQLVEREPVYVTGSIPAPATLKFSPGMTVLQASIMASAGQSQSAADQRLRDLELTRERERVQQSDDNLAKALARRAVLTAERDGRPPAMPIALSKLLPDQSGAILKDAQSLRQSELSKEKEQSAGLDTALDAMEKELALMRSSLAQTEFLD